jgi:alkaline phosphatase
VRGYRSFFGDSVTTNEQLHYGFGAGTWQALSLDSNCEEIDCSSAGAQYAWASSQLAAWSAIDPSGCSIVEYHHPVSTSYAVDADADARFAETFAMLETQGVDVVVAGHVHAYERFAAVDAALNPDETGTTQFTVGTGGKSHYNPKGEPDVKADFYTDSRYGVLFLRLYSASYTFEFIDVDGNVVDSGERSCR